MRPHPTPQTGRLDAERRRTRGTLLGAAADRQMGRLPLVGSETYLSGNGLTLDGRECNFASSHLCSMRRVQASGSD